MRWPLWMLLLAALAVAAAALWRAGGPAVTVAQATRGPAVEAVYATGVVEPVLVARLTPFVAGRIAAILAREGETVHAGQVLARLDAREPEANRAAIEARIGQLEAEVRRQRDLVRKQYTTPQALERAQAELKEAQARLRASDKPLADTAITAPLDGVVLRQDGEPGEVVDKAFALFTVGRPDLLRITADVDEEDIPRIQPGQEALIKADAFPDADLRGRVDSVTPQGDPVNKNFRVRLALPAGTPLRIGMTVEVNILIERHEAAVLAPTGALSGNQIWVLDGDGRVAPRQVSVGVRGEQRTEILSGLAEGETVVVNPPAQLAAGARPRTTPQRP